MSDQVFEAGLAELLAENKKRRRRYKRQRGEKRRLICEKNPNLFAGFKFFFVIGGALNLKKVDKLKHIISAAGFF